MKNNDSVAVIPPSLREGFAMAMAIFFSASFPFQASALTFKEALQSAINYHPQIIADRASSEAVKATIDQQYAGFYPTVDIFASGGLAYVEENFKQNQLQSALQGESRQATAAPAISLKQLLYDGESTTYQVKKAIADFEQAYGSYLNTVDTRALRAALAYIQVLRFQQIKALILENRKIHRRILKQITELVSKGELTEADQVQVHARLEDVQISLVSVQGQLETAKADFREAVGRAPDDLSPVVIPVALITPQISRFLEEVFRKNKSLQAAQADIRSAKANLEVAKSNSYPVLTFEANAAHDINANGVRGDESRAAGLVVLRYNLADGGTDAARRQGARERVTESGGKLAVQRTALVQEVQTSWATRDSATRQIVYTQKAIRDKNEVALDYAKQFLVGLRSLIDELNAWRDLFESKVQLVAAEATEELMKARLLTASSSLLEAFQIPVPKQATGYSPLGQDVTCIQEDRHKTASQQDSPAFPNG